MSRFGRCWSCLAFPVVLLGMPSSPSRGGPPEGLAKLCDDIWQQSRQDLTGAGQLISPRDLWDATRAAGDNFFVVKVSYWLGVN